jgi:hypothetical protein
MRLILHAGTHKTGTTSIQAVLAENRKWLDERGYVFPALCGSQTSHNHFAHRLAVARPEDEELLQSELMGATARNRTTILSGEEVSARIVGTKNWDGYNADDYWDRRVRFLQRVRAAMRDFEDITVHLCLRRADDFAESIYATMLLSGRYRGSLEQFVSDVAPIFDYGRQVEAFRNIFGDVRVAPFNELSSDLIPQFFRWTGIPLPPSPAKRKKVTPDKRLIYWIHRMIESNGYNEADVRLLAQFVRSRPAGHALTDRRPATLWRDQALREIIVRRSAAGLPNTFFAEQAPKVLASAHLDDPELARITGAFESWRAQSSGSRFRRGIRSIVSMFRPS